MLARLVARATFYDGFITGALIGITLVMTVFAYHLGAFDYRETTIAVIIGLGFNILIIVGATLSRVRRWLAEE